MDEVQVDVEQVGLAVGPADDVAVPHLLRSVFPIVAICPSHILRYSLDYGTSVSGVGVLDKAVAILDALERGRGARRELDRRPGCPAPRPTGWPTALEVHGLVERDGAGRSPRRRARWPRRHAGRRRPGPALERPARRHRESVQLYVRRGDGRVCVVSLESPHGLRTIVPVGAASRSTGARPARCSGTRAVRKRGWAQSVEERERGVASVSAPVCIAGAVVAAVSVSGPIERTTRSPGKRYATAVVRPPAG